MAEGNFSKNHTQDSNGYTMEAVNAPTADQNLAVQQTAYTRQQYAYLPQQAGAAPQFNDPPPEYGEATPQYEPTVPQYGGYPPPLDTNERQINGDHFHRQENVSIYYQVPPNYSGLAMFVCLCCCIPLGRMAIRESREVDMAIANGRFDKAEEHSRRAKRYIILGISIGSVMCVVFGLVLVLRTIYHFF